MYSTDTWMVTENTFLVNDFIFQDAFQMTSHFYKAV